MSTLYTEKSKNIYKTFLLMGVFALTVVTISMFVSWYLNNVTILYLGAASAFFTSVGSYWFSDKVVVSMTGAVPADPATHKELIQIVENLSITAGLPMPKVYIVNDPAPNAFATGRNPEHSIVAVTTGLLEILNRSELEGVIAHELSHIGNRDMLVMTVAVVLAGFLAVLSDLFTRTLFYSGGRNSQRQGGGNAVLILVGILGIILAPLAARLIQFAVSRKREYLADASGALLTRYPEGLASALQKIGQYKIPMRRASRATAHLFISNPMPKKRGMAEKISNLFSTHPPIEDRIRRLLGKDY